MQKQNNRTVDFTPTLRRVLWVGVLTILSVTSYGQKRVTIRAWSVSSLGSEPLSIWSDFDHDGNRFFTNSETVVVMHGENWTNLDMGDTIVHRGKVHFVDSLVQTITGRSEMWSEMIINNEKTVHLRTDWHIGKTLDLKRGRLVLDSSELTLGSGCAAKNYTDERFIVTQRAGFVTMCDLDSQYANVILPLGSRTDSYTPLSFIHHGGKDTFRFQVFDTVRAGGLTGAPESMGNAGKSWRVDRLGSDTGKISVVLQHNSVDQASGFNPNRRFVSRYVGYAPNSEGDTNSSSYWDYRRLTSTTSAKLCGSLTTGDTIITALETHRDSFKLQSPLTTMSYPDVSMPVDWLEIQAVWISSYVAAVLWQTASEFNNAGFIVFRSYDGVQFDSISFVPSQHPGGSSTTTTHYSFTDNPRVYTKVVYYRLKQIDFDASGDWSPIVRLRAAEDNMGLIVYPNPTSGKWYILLPEGWDENLQLQVYNQIGQDVFQSIYFSLDTGLVEIDRDLAPGIYTVLLGRPDGGVQHVKRLIIE